MIKGISIFICLLIANNVFALNELKTFKSAYTSLKSSNYSASLGHLNDLLKEDMHNPSLLYNRALAYYNLGFSDSALTDLDLSISLFEFDPHSFFNRATINYELGRYDRAVEDLKRAIALEEGYTAAYALRAKCYDKLDLHQKAIDDLDIAIGQHNGIADYYYDRGRLHVELGNYDNALLDLNRCLAKNVNLNEAYWALGDLYFYKNDYTNSISNYKEYLNSENESYLVEQNLGISLLLNGQAKEAKVHFENALLLNDSDADLHYNFALLLFELKDFEQSAYQMSIAIENGVESEKAFLYRAHAYENTNNLYGAFKDYKKMESLGFANSSVKQAMLKAQLSIFLSNHWINLLLAFLTLLFTILFLKKWKFARRLYRKAVTA